MSYTTSEILLIAKKCQFLVSNYIQKGGLNGGGIDLRLAKKIKNISESIEYIYNLDNSDSTLFATGNYLLALCMPYVFKAVSISGSGGVIAPVTPDVGNTPAPYQFEVSGSSFIVTGQSSKTISNFVNYNLIFVRNNITQSVVDNGGSYYSWDKTTGLFTCTPAAQETELFQLFAI